MLLPCDRCATAQDPSSVSVMAPDALPAVTPAALGNLPSARPVSADGSAPGSPGAVQKHHIWLVTGPAGCGKSTIAESLAASLNMPYIEGDSVRNPRRLDGLFRRAARRASAPEPDKGLADKESSSTPKPTSRRCGTASP